MAIGSGQGQIAGSQSIVQFDDWTPIILFQTDCGSYTGDGENTTRFYDTFVDLDKDGKLDLVEVTTINNGRNNRPPIVETIRKKFMFKNNAFIKYVDYKKQLPH